MNCGVSKSGSPAPNPQTSLPAALRAFALASTAKVGEGAMFFAQVERGDAELSLLIFVFGMESKALPFPRGNANAFCSPRARAADSGDEKGRRRRCQKNMGAPGRGGGISRPPKSDFRV